MIALLCLGIWLYLLVAHGRYWQSGPELDPSLPPVHPDVDIVVPARDEAQTIAPVIASLLAQDYRGTFRVLLVDDDSTDDTAAAAGTAPNLTIITGQPKPDGWSGKLWALAQGVAASRAPILLFTDADIIHDPRHLSTLVARLLQSHADQADATLPHADQTAPSQPGTIQHRVGPPRTELVSEMVRLNCSSLAERALVPAFVYFFQMLYPFSKVNDPSSPVAAAAGGTILIRRETLQRVGGIESIRGALIDDVTLARVIKPHGALYLGHSGLATSIRPYPRFADIWRMIARTAFTQLRYSAVLLALAVTGLALVWLGPLAQVLLHRDWRFACGLIAFALGAMTYVPTLARFRLSYVWSLLLPAVAAFYMAATVGSALGHWFGRGARWKSRAYGDGRKAPPP